MTDTIVEPGSGAAIKAASARIADPEQRVLERIAEIGVLQPDCNGSRAAATVICRADDNRVTPHF